MPAQHAGQPVDIGDSNGMYDTKSCHAEIVAVGAQLSISPCEGRCRGLNPCPVRHGAM